MNYAAMGFCGGISNPRASFCAFRVNLSRYYLNNSHVSSSVQDRLVDAGVPPVPSTVGNLTLKAKEPNLSRIGSTEKQPSKPVLLWCPILLTAG